MRQADLCAFPYIQVLPVSTRVSHTRLRLSVRTHFSPPSPSEPSSWPSNSPLRPTLTLVPELRKLSGTAPP